MRGKYPDSREARHRARVLEAQARELGIEVSAYEIRQDPKSWEAIIYAHTPKTRRPGDASD